MQQNQSRLGIASYIISITIVAVTALFYMLATTGLAGSEMEEMTKNSTVRMWLLGSFLIAFVGCSIGIGSLFIKGKMKKFSYLGTILNLVIILCIVSFLTVYYKHNHGYFGIEKFFFAKPDPFISFINKFAQEPFLLEEKEDYYVNTLSKTQLRFLRNTILARRGYIFESKDLDAFFRRRKWYVPFSNKIEVVEMDKKYADIDRENEAYVLLLEEPDKIRFDNFLKLFKNAKLPIEIKNEEYGAIYSKRIPICFIKKFIKKSGYLSLQAIDMVYANNRFIAVLYGYRGTGVKIILKTYKPDGSEISDILVAVYGGDLSGFSTSTAQIDQNLNVNVEIKGYSREYDDASHKTKNDLENTTSEKYVIDQNGDIKKR